MSRRARRGRGAGAVAGLEDAPRVALEIERLSAGGDGVAREASGRVVFVPYTAPGDRVRARLVEQRPRYARARVETLLARGDVRVDPVCPVFGSCGGCTWQHVAYPAQLAAKRRIVEDALGRIGRVPWSGEVEMVASPLAYGYRHRARLRIADGRIGYLRRRSSRLEPVRRCPVLAPALDAALAEQARRRLEGACEVELALGCEGARVTRLTARASEGSPPAAVGDATHEGADPPLHLRAGEDLLRISPGVFFQANASLHEPLAEALLREAGLGEHVLELFAGAGFFTLRLARRFTAVTALEADPAAVADLRANLAAAGLTAVRVLEARLEDALPALPAADVLVLDPPRGGLPPGATADLAEAGARRIVYLSCDPATLARDLGGLCGAGYRLMRIVAFDLFPQTPHVEVLARLERADGREAAGLVHSPG